MTFTLARPSAPRCTRCLRQLLRRVADSDLRPLQQQQIRGKKKMANLKETIPVRLLKDMQSYGPAGKYMLQIRLPLSRASGASYQPAKLTRNKRLQVPLFQ